MEDFTCMGPIKWTLGFSSGGLWIWHFGWRSSWHRVRRQQTFSISQGLFWLLEGVLSQKGLGRLQDRVDEWPARLDILHECLPEDREESVSKWKNVFRLRCWFNQKLINYLKKKRKKKLCSRWQLLTSNISRFITRTLLSDWSKLFVNSTVPNLTSLSTSDK